MILFAKQALRAEHQEGQCQDIGEPVLDGAAECRTPIAFCDLLADADD